MEELAVVQKIGWDNAISESPSLHLVTSSEFAAFYDYLIQTPHKEQTFKNWMGEYARFLEDRHWAFTVFHPSVINSKIMADSSLVIAKEVRDSFCPGSISYDGFKLRTSPHELYGCY